MFKDPIAVFVMGDNRAEEIRRIRAILVEHGLHFTTECFCQFISKDKYASCETVRFTPDACTDGSFIIVERADAKTVIKTIKQVRKDISTDK